MNRRKVKLSDLCNRAETSPPKHPAPPQNNAKDEQVQKTLANILETLVEDHGMPIEDAGSAMLEAAEGVAGKDGVVYLNVVIREIEKRNGKSLYDD